MSEFVHEINVPFRDTDMAGVVHFTRILGYVEEAEHLFLLENDAPIMSDEGGFPKVHVECDYRAPIRFGDTILVRVKLVKISEKSLQWEFSVNKATTTCAKGKIVTAMVTGDGKSAPIPYEWSKKLTGLM